MSRTKMLTSLSLIKLSVADVYHREMFNLIKKYTHASVNHSQHYFNILIKFIINLSPYSDNSTMLCSFTHSKQTYKCWMQISCCEFRTNRNKKKIERNMKKLQNIHHIHSLFIVPMFVVSFQWGVSCQISNLCSQWKKINSSLDHIKNIK